jgi:hypothetical protein
MVADTRNFLPNAVRLLVVVVVLCRLAEEVCKGRDCPWLVLASPSIRGREGASGSTGAASVPRAGHQTIGRTNPQRARRNRKAVARQPKP